MERRTNQLSSFLLLGLLVWILGGCYSPAHSQKYFIKATEDDGALDPLYSTALYTVYYDHALVRCVVHSTHTWGQSGGGGGGTGIGIQVFRCDPNRIRQRAEDLGLKTYSAKIVSPSPPKPVSAKRVRSKRPPLGPAKESSTTQTEQHPHATPPQGAPQRKPQQTNPQLNRPMIGGGQ